MTSTQHSENSLPAVTLWVMTIATGLCVANLYYCQPLLHQMQESFGGTDRELGWIPTLTQVGYALGMLFMVPLGDTLERRKLVVGFTALSAAALLVMSFSQTLLMGAIVSLVIGFMTMTPQLILPFAAHLANPAKRGQVVGTVMSGLLLGILLARTIAGFVGAAFGWRAMFASAAVALIILAILLRLLLPKSEPSFHGTYGELLGSVFQLMREQPVLRESMIYGATLFASFSAFWATLIHLMETDSFHLGARAVGMFGLLGAAGALVAPLVGKIADKKSPKVTIGLGFAITILAFLIYWAWGGSSLVALSIGVLLMDVGVQSGHVSNQSRVFALNPEARSRLNTAYMFAYFIGGAAGSWVATFAWSLYGWPGVCGAALTFLALGCARFGYRRRTT